MKMSLKLLALVLLLSSVTLAKDSLKKHVVELKGVTASISLPDAFTSDTTKDPTVSAMFSAREQSSNCLLANLGENLTGADLKSPTTLQGIKARVEKRQGRILESAMTKVANRPTLRVVVAIPRADKMMVQERYLLSGNPGWVVMFTTTEARSKTLLAGSKQWIQTLRFAK